MSRSLRGRAAVARGGKVGGGEAAGDGASVVAKKSVHSLLEESQKAIAYERLLLSVRERRRPRREVLHERGNVRQGLADLAVGVGQDLLTGGAAWHGLGGSGATT